MQIRKTASGFAIQFPFALKDAFRAAFPSSKWDALTKEWTVGPRSGKRLEAWAAEAQQAAADIAAREEAELAQAELAKVRADIEAARQQARTAAEYHAELQAVREELEAAQAELAQAAAQAAAAKAENRKEQDKIAALLKNHIDLPAIAAAKKAMEQNMVPGDRIKKQRFEEAREVIKAERDKLAAAGLRLQALSELASANINRPDRDHPSNINPRAWFEVSRITGSNE